MARHRMPSGTVRRYHGRLASAASVRFSFGVTDLTKPTSSSSGFGLVTMETRMEAMMSVTNAKDAATKAVPCPGRLKKLASVLPKVAIAQ